MSILYWAEKLSYLASPTAFSTISGVVLLIWASLWITWSETKAHGVWSFQIWSDRCHRARAWDLGEEWTPKNIFWQEDARRSSSPITESPQRALNAPLSYFRTLLPLLLSLGNLQPYNSFDLLSPLQPGELCTAGLTSYRTYNLYSNFTL